MTITYSLAPNPKWYIADLVGRPLGAGKMYTYSSLNKTVQKFVFQDPAGSIPWPDPILFDENGSQGPFYWKADSAQPLDLYYVEVYDVNGVLQWTIDNFDGVSGSGGGGTTTILDVSNLLVNNIFWRGVASTPVLTPTAFKIAPGIHTGLVQTTSLYGPDIYFYKSNTNCTDAITLPAFSVGSNSLTGDLTPQNYLNYTCTAVNAGGETYKYLQIPICKNVQNLQNTPVAVTIWARCNSGTPTLTVYNAQFFGDGASASAPVQNLMQALTLTSSWQQFTIKVSIPTISTKVIGACHNDGLFLQLAFPLNSATNIDLIKPCIYLGTVAPTQQFSPIESIESLINSPRTGHVISGYDLAAPYGYLLMDDLTIGRGSSAATSNPISASAWLGRSDYTFPLYNLLWNSVSSPSTNTLCIVSGGALGASAAADFEAGKTLTLQAALGRVIAASGTGAGLTAAVLGSIIGANSTTQVPNHVHTFSSDSGAFLNFEIGQGNLGLNPTSNVIGEYVTGTTANNTGGVASVSIMQPTSFMNFYIKL